LIYFILFADLVKKWEDLVKKWVDFKNHENQNYNFPGKKEECATWHLKKFLRCIKVPLDLLNARWHILPFFLQSCCFDFYVPDLPHIFFQKGNEGFFV
jgi:hypothetical protein